MSVFNNKIIFFKRDIFIFFLIFSFKSNAIDYDFDSSLLQGDSKIDLNKLGGDKVNPGTYSVDLYVNGKQALSDETVSFKKDGEKVEPCLDYKTLSKIGFNFDKNSKDDKLCHPASFWSKNIKWNYESSILKLNLSIPMTEMVNRPRGYISPDELDAGGNILFISHNTNYTKTIGSHGNSSYQYLWSGIKTGINFGLWQVRHQGNFRYNSQSTRNQFDYSPVRTWIQRPIDSIDSELKIGDSYTKDSLFGSLSFRGLQMSTDERMLPQSQRGYAPEVRGVASSSARVIVSQLGKQIYETTVPPGPFVINDLYNTSNQGDLSVQVIESTGKTSTFVVPYSSVPDSVRPGNTIYSLSVGNVRGYDSLQNKFLELIFQRGIDNGFTANIGSRYGQGYLALLAGGVWTSRIGALGTNVTYSKSDYNDIGKDSGWRAELNFSKSLDTGTNLLFAAYHYSTKGFRDLSDVLGERLEYSRNSTYYSDTLNQLNEFNLSLSQSLGDYGTLNLTGSTSTYYGNKSRVSQLQFGYNGQWKRLNYSINVARQRTAYSNYYTNDSNSYQNSDKYTENTISFNISIPLQIMDNLSSVSYSYNTSKETTSSTVAMNGSTGSDNGLTYSLYGGYQQTKGADGDSTFGGSLNTSTGFGSFNTNYNQSNTYKQVGVGLSGTALVHSGGVTFGPYAGETFALIYADGARGAKIQNGLGSTIDTFGYAILPSLTPYQINNVYLDASTLDTDAELVGGGVRVAPYAGAIPKISFSTRKGKPVLITINNSENELPPMGSDVEDEKGVVIGMVGQGGQVYARVNGDSGRLSIKWQAGQQMKCNIFYKIPSNDKSYIHYMNLKCER